MIARIVSSLIVLMMLVGANGAQPVYASVDASTPTPTLVRVSFAKGATSAVVDGTLSGRTWQDYVVRGSAGSTLLVSLTAGNSDTSFKVYRRYYRASLRGSGDGMTTWQRALPASGDYIIRVTGPISTVYSLNVMIPAVIRFRRGTYGATVTGHTSDNRINTYLAWGRVGQTLTATLISPVDVGITVYGLTDGIPMVRAVSGAVTWSGKLQSSQNYMIDVVPSITTTVNYTLSVEIR